MFSSCTWICLCFSFFVFLKIIRMLRDPFTVILIWQINDRLHCVSVLEGKAHRSSVFKLVLPSFVWTWYYRGPNHPRNKAVRAKAVATEQRFHVCAEHFARESAGMKIRPIKKAATELFCSWVHYLNQQEVRRIHLINRHPLNSTAGAICC